MIPADQLESFLKEMHGRFLGTMNAVGKQDPNSSIVYSCDGGRGVIEALAKKFGLDVEVSKEQWVNVYAPEVKPMRKIVHAEAQVQIEIREGSDAITRVTGPDGDRWRGNYYLLIRTEADVLDFWAAKAISNNVMDASTLDGWEDLERGEVTMEVL